MEAHKGIQSSGTPKACLARAGLGVFMHTPSPSSTPAKRAMWAAPPASAAAATR